MPSTTICVRSTNSVRRPALRQRIRARRRAADDPLPLLGQKRQPPRGKPVHVIQEHETRNRPRVLRQKAFHRIGVRLHAIGQPVAKLLEILGLEVFRTTLPRIAARHVDPPEIVVAQRQPGENRLDAVLDETARFRPGIAFRSGAAGPAGPPGARESNRGAWRNASTWTRIACGGGDRRFLAAGRRSSHSSRSLNYGRSLATRLI